MVKPRLLVMAIVVTIFSSTAPPVFSFQLQEPFHQLLSYTHVWPEMEFGWRIVLATLLGFLGAALGGAGGVGGGGFFVAVLVLVIGFDIKSSAAISACMVMATAGVTACLSLKKMNPTSEQPLIDYDLVLLIHPMLLLGVTIGVAFNVIFAEWMLTLLLFILFLVMSVKAFIKGVEVWNKETNATEESTQELGSIVASDEAEYEPLLWRAPSEAELPLVTNVPWKEVGVVVAVWIAILVLQISKSFATSCSVAYWVLDLLQIPVAVGVCLHEAMKLHTGMRAAGLRRNWKRYELALCCVSAVLAGTASAMLGLNGGFILGPLFLHLGISPHVSSATTALAMAFSSSISVVEYSLLRRFPFPYAVYFVGVAMAATLVGNVVIRNLARLGGRVSIVVFVLASVVLVTALLLGADVIIEVIDMVENGEYSGLEGLC